MSEVEEVRDGYKDGYNVVRRVEDELEVGDRVRKHTHIIRGYYAPTMVDRRRSVCGLDPGEHWVSYKGGEADCLECNLLYFGRPPPWFRHLAFEALVEKTLEGDYENARMVAELIDSWEG